MLFTESRYFFEDSKRIATCNGQKGLEIIEILKKQLKNKATCDIIDLLKYEVDYIAVSYNKLWKLWIDRNMTKTMLVKNAGITTNAMARMGRNGDMRVEVLVKICNTLECNLDDIIEITK